MKRTVTNAETYHTIDEFLTNSRNEELSEKVYMVRAYCEMFAVVQR